jgi:hypothetical protein
MINVMSEIYIKREKTHQKTGEKSKVGISNLIAKGKEVIVRLSRQANCRLFRHYDLNTEYPQKFMKNFKCIQNWFNYESILNLKNFT